MAKLRILVSVFRFSLRSKVLGISVGFFSPFFLSRGHSTCFSCLNVFMKRSLPPRLKPRSDTLLTVQGYVCASPVYVWSLMCMHMSVLGDFCSHSLLGAALVISSLALGLPLILPLGTQLVNLQPLQRQG